MVVQGEPLKEDSMLDCFGESFPSRIKTSNEVLRCRANRKGERSDRVVQCSTW